MKYNKIYNIDFVKLINLITPVFLRKNKFIDWMCVLIKPLEEVNYFFKLFRKSSIYKVTHNGQVYSLQAVLNDSYDKDLRRIRVVDSFVQDPLWIYPENDNKPVYVYPENDNKPVYVYPDSIFDDINVDFLVLIPVEYKPSNQESLNILEVQIKSLINYYKLASKRYKILWT